MNIALLWEIECDFLEGIFEDIFIILLCELWLVGEGSVDIFLDLDEGRVIILISGVIRLFVLDFIDFEEFKPKLLCIVFLGESLEVITALIFVGISQTISHIIYL